MTKIRDDSDRLLRALALPEGVDAPVLRRFDGTSGTRFWGWRRYWVDSTGRVFCSGNPLDSSRRRSALFQDESHLVRAGYVRVPADDCLLPEGWL